MLKMNLYSYSEEMNYSIDKDDKIVITAKNPELSTNLIPDF